MPPSDALIPAWVDRIGTLVVLSVVGSVAAWSTVWFLMGFVVGDNLFWAWIFNLEVVAVLSCACGLVVGIAGASAPTWPGVFRRAGIAALVLLVLGLAAIAAVASALR